MDKDVTGLFAERIKTRRNLSRRGDYTNFDCPACGDKRGRGGFMTTETNGFRYHCFNGGCDYNKATGWEPGSPVGFRAKRLYELLGGNISELPIIIPSVDRLPRRTEIRVPVNYPNYKLPKSFHPLCNPFNNDMQDCLLYLHDRHPVFLDYIHRFWWDENDPRSVVLDYRYRNRIVGFLKRSIDDKKFYVRQPKNFIFGLDLLRRGEGYIPVVESPFDALLFRGVATQTNTINKVIEKALLESERTPILVPDRVKKEINDYLNKSVKNGWPLFLVPAGYKDIGEYARDRGLFGSIMDMMEKKITKNQLLTVQMELNIGGE